MLNIQQTLENKTGGRVCAWAHCTPCC